MANDDKPSVLVISAHAVDFVWKCAGTMARYAQNGSKVRVIDLTFGERGESGEVWKSRKGVTEDEGKKIRKEEAENACRILGAEVRFLDWGDHPLEINRERIMRLVDEMREFQPNIILTHHTEDPLNPDHPATAEAFLKALRCARQPGVNPGTPVLGPCKTFLFEPSEAEFCNFTPDVYIDISDVMDIKNKAIDAVLSQRYLHEPLRIKAEFRGYLAGRIGGNKGITHAETFKRFNAYVGKYFA